MSHLLRNAISQPVSRISGNPRELLAAAPFCSSLRVHFCNSPQIKPAHESSGRQDYSFVLSHGYQISNSWMAPVWASARFPQKLSVHIQLCLRQKSGILFSLQQPDTLVLLGVAAGRCLSCTTRYFLWFGA